MFCTAFVFSFSHIDSSGVLLFSRMIPFASITVVLFFFDTLAFVNVLCQKWRDQCARKERGEWYVLLAPPSVVCGPFSTGSVF